jgi:hypothetical protein
VGGHDLVPGIVGVGGRGYDRSITGVGAVEVPKGLVMRANRFFIVMLINNIINIFNVDSILLIPVFSGDLGTGGAYRR